MSRVVKNVIVWVLALAVILCIIAGFTFGLSSVSGVADAAIVDDALVKNLVNNGKVRPNYFEYSSASEIYDSIITNNGYWKLSLPAGDGEVFCNLTEDGYFHAGSTGAGASSANLVFSPNLRPSHALGFTLTFQAIRRRDDFPIFDSTGFSVQFLNDDGSHQTGESQKANTRGIDSGTVFTASFDFTFNSTDKVILKSLSIQLNDTFDISYLKFEFYELDEEPGFTGYVPYSKGTYDDGYNAGYDTGYEEGYNAGVTDGTQTGYDKGHADGYDEGYNNGLADEVYTASQAFKSSGYNYVSVLSDGTSTRFEADKKIGALVSDFENVNIPLSGLYFAASDLVADDSGGSLVLPSDFESLTGDTVYELFASSQYAITFDNYVVMAQWLIDNPMDNLVLIPSDINNPSSDGIYPIYFVMNDRSLLERFVSGAGAAYDLGYQGGYNAGYDVGDGDGYNRGYGVGFNDGQSDALSGNYTFLGLIGSVIDAPISAFRGLLDFELLGVNMSSFVLAVMSLCVIIVIIRMVLR